MYFSTVNHKTVSLSGLSVLYLAAYHRYYGILLWYVCTYESLTLLIHSHLSMYLNRREYYV